MVPQSKTCTIPILWQLHTIAHLSKDFTGKERLQKNFFIFVRFTIFATQSCRDRFLPASISDNKLKITYNYGYHTV